MKPWVVVARCRKKDENLGLGSRADQGAVTAKTRLDEAANESTLSDSERAEYEEFVEGFDLFSILKAKAKAILAKHGS